MATNPCLFLFCASLYSSKKVVVELLLVTLTGDEKMLEEFATQRSFSSLFLSL